MTGWSWYLYSITNTCTCLYNFSSLFRFIHSKLLTETSEREPPPKGSNNFLYGSKQLKEAYQSIFSLYSDFVGPLHFQAFSRLLGYQGIAMLLEQLLNVIDSCVS